MDANGLKELKWVPYQGGWGNLNASAIHSEHAMVCRKDIKDFTKALVKRYAVILGVPYEQFKLVFQAENLDFFLNEDVLFSSFPCVSPNNETLKDLQRMLKIPDLSSMKN